MEVQRLGRGGTTIMGYAVHSACALENWNGERNIFSSASGIECSFDEPDHNNNNNINNDKEKRFMLPISSSSIKCQSLTRIIHALETALVFLNLWRKFLSTDHFFTLGICIFEWKTEYFICWMRIEHFITKRLWKRGSIGAVLRHQLMLRDS